MLEGRAARPCAIREATASFLAAEKLDLEVGDTLRIHFFRADTLPRRPPARCSPSSTSDSTPRAVMPASDYARLADGPGHRVQDRRDRGVARRVPAPPGGHLARHPPHPGVLRALERQDRPEPAALHPAPARDRRPARRSSGGSSAWPATSRSRSSRPGPPRPTRVQRAIRVQATALRIFGIIVLAAFLVPDPADHLPPGPGRVPGRLARSRSFGMSSGQLIALPILWAAIVAVPAAILAAGIAVLLSPFGVVGLARKANPDPGFSLDVPVVAHRGRVRPRRDPAADAVARDPAGAGLAGHRGLGAAGPAVAGRAVDRARAWRGRRPRPSGSASGSRPAGAPARSRCRAPSSASRSASGCSSRPSASVRACSACSTPRALYGWTWDIKTGAPALPNIGQLVVPALPRRRRHPGRGGRDGRPGRPRGPAGRRARRHPREGQTWLRP